MSKKDIDFDKLSSLKPKKTEAKADPEQAVKSIHDKSPEKEKVKRQVIRQEGKERQGCRDGDKRVEQKEGKV